MILNELFENKNMTEAMKPSDVPTALRTNRLSMQDIEAERPQGTFRFQVTYPDGHVSYFMDKTAAEQAAGPEGGRVDLVNQVPQGNPGRHRFRVRDPQGNKPGATFQDRASAERYASAKRLPVEIIPEEKKSSSNARIERILKMLRAKHPQAENDLEALIFDFRSQQSQDRADISRLDRENDMEEADIERLEQMLNLIKKRRGDAVSENLTYSGPPETVGYMYITMIERTKRTAEPIVLDYGFGKGRYKIADPRQKAWLLNRYAEAQKAAKKNPEFLNAFLINMGTQEGFEALARRMQKELGGGDVAVASDATAKTQMAEQSKKKSKISEDDLDTVNPRTKRILRSIRARQPQATSDVEALLYDVRAQQKKDREDIGRLEKQRDDLEQDLKKDLEREIDTLKQRRSPRVNLDQIKATNTKQDQAIQRLTQIQRKQDELDAEQSQAISDLESAVKSGKEDQPAPAMPTGGSRTVAKPAPVPAGNGSATTANKKLSPQSFGQMAQQLVQPAPQTRQVRGIPREIPIAPVATVAQPVATAGQPELDLPDNVTPMRRGRGPRQAELSLAAENKKIKKELQK